MSNFYDELSKNLSNKVGIKQAEILLSMTPQKMLVPYEHTHNKNDEDWNYQKEIQKKNMSDCVDSIIKGYGASSELEVSGVNDEVRQRLEVIKSKYLDTAIIDSELADAMKFLISTYLGIDKADAFLDLYPKTEKPKTEKFHKKEFRFYNRLY